MTSITDFDVMKRSTSSEWLMSVRNWPKAVVREWQLSVRSDPSGVQ